MKFGFIAHVTNENEMNMLKCLNQFNFLFSKQDNTEDSSLVDYISFNIISKSGATCEGKIAYIPLYSEDIMQDPSEATRQIKEAALELEAWGAEIIGLGGYTAVVGKRGVEVQNVLTKAVITTGNTFTAAISMDTLDYILEMTKRTISGVKITIIGFPGSISMVIARALSKNATNITLVGRRESHQIQNFLNLVDGENDVNISFTTDIKDAVSDADIVMSATTTGNIIDQEWLKKGACVIDIGEPKDVIKLVNRRDDILVVDGGRFSIEEDVTIDIPFQNMFRTNFFGCVGETILLALEGNLDNRSIGRELSEENVQYFRKIGKKHGFTVNNLSSWGNAIPTTDLLKLQVSENLPHKMTIAEIIKNATKEEVFEKHRQYINSVLVAYSEAGKYDRLYTVAKGMYIWDLDGKKYYDFIGGYGSVNIGHNHPEIEKGIKEYFSAPPPSLLQVSPGLFGANLAEKLISFLPKGLDRVFFCNSGTEAVEGALKLARIKTNRTKYVSTYNSFHGKSYGSLSVTGREKYQAPYRPLLDEVSFIEYGDSTNLEALLENNDVAAMIIEPVQGEGGVIVPPANYIKRCKDICSKYGTLLILDEVQTGFGRTGKMFAFEHYNVIPDILTLAKSLGGSLVPIGAYVTSEDVWASSYGSQSKYLLHTSTFGGNNFCSAIGITALNVIEENKLAENAHIIGTYLKTELEKIAENYSFIKEVRGQGLLIGVQFQYNTRGGMQTLLDNVLGMVPLSVKNTLLSLPSSIVDSLTNVLNDNINAVEDYLSENFATLFNSEMLNQHQIISIVTLSNPYVMRIEPPLIITKEDADYFIHGFKQTCEKFKIINVEKG